MPMVFGRSFIGVYGCQMVAVSRCLSEVFIIVLAKEKCRLNNQLWFTSFRALNAAAMGAVQGVAQR
jgi:hypothetical protein